MSTKNAKKKDTSARELTDIRIDMMKTGCQCECLKGWPKLNEGKPFTRIFYKSTGMFIEVSKTDRKTFRYTYRDSEGKQKLITIGRFNGNGDNVNNFNLAQAKAIYELAIDKLKQQNIDPQKEREKAEAMADKEKERSKTTFATILPEWYVHEKFMPKHKKKVEQRILKFCTSILNEPIHTIDEDSLRVILESIKATKQDTANRLHSSLRQIFNYAKKVKRIIDFDPSRDIDASEFPAVKNKRFKHTLDLLTLQQVLKLINSNTTGEIQTITGLKLAPYLFTRPAELRLMRWSDIDFTKRIWSLHKAKVIGREIDSVETQNSEPDFLVPLSQQAIDLLKTLELHKNSDYVFAIRCDEAPSDSTFSKALRVLLKENGLTGKQTVHGFRHVFRSLAEGELGLSRRVIEQQMSHSEIAKSSDKHFYDQNLYVPERHAMMDIWATFIDAIRDDYKEYDEDEYRKLISEGGQPEFEKIKEKLKRDYLDKTAFYKQVKKHK